jgi:hypothetical protein
MKKSRRPTNPEAVAFVCVSLHGCLELPAVEALLETRSIHSKLRGIFA